MIRVQIRIVAALVALSVLTVAVLGAYYMYRENMMPEKERKKEIKALMETGGPKVDPGKKIHEQAMGLIRRGEMEGAREKLMQIIDVCTKQKLPSGEPLTKLSFVESGG